MSTPASSGEGDGPPRRRQTSHPRHANRQKQSSHPASGAGDEFMGSIVRHKKVVSLPLGAQSEFFNNGIQAIPESKEFQARDPGLTPPASPKGPRATTRKPFVEGILRRKQVSLDLLASGEANFFNPPTEVEKNVFVPPVDDLHDVDEEVADLIPFNTGGTVEEPLTVLEPVTVDAKLFLPLRFTPPTVTRGGGGHHQGHKHGQLEQEPTLEQADEQTCMIVQRQVENNQVFKRQMETVYTKLDGVDNEFLQELRKTQEDLDKGTAFLEKLLLKAGTIHTISEHAEEAHEEGHEDAAKVAEDKVKEVNEDVLKATKSDLRWTALLFMIMLAFTIVICTWHTHLDESALIRTPVGLACATPCEDQTFFEEGHNTFKAGQFMELLMHLDPNHDTESLAIVEIVGVESGEVKATVNFGPSNEHERLTFHEKISVDFDNPGEEHAIQVFSTKEETTLTFTLHVSPFAPLAKNSVIVAAVILVTVYLFILLEVIHRTLVAIFGSMIALFFLFVMNGGRTLSIASVMLFMEWSTIGLLFGMMIIIGELSHTGIFEWFAVRLLVSSKGSFRRLAVLLCGLTAVASAFLDNVTTMLLVAPVTIDMCKILNVDPRPYLIGEVILSNIGGTATLIGDPPNIIIGTSIEGIDFVDFVIYVAPCVFFFLIPVSLAMILWIYNHYFTAFTMPELNIKELKKTYPIYDEPRLLIAGTVAFFVILAFFLHPVHHKDTAWIALFGALMTMSFTNPHDVQDALRNHVEWDTLLFFAGLFVLVEVCAEMGLLEAIGDLLSDYISAQPESSQLPTAITLIIWVSAIASAFIDNIPWTATMIPIIKILAEELPDLPLKTLAWALSFGACLGGNGTLLGASANIVTAGIATNKGYKVSFLNFLYPGFIIMLVTVAVANLYLLVLFVWV